MGVHAVYIRISMRLGAVSDSNKECQVTILYMLLLLLHSFTFVLLHQHLVFPTRIRPKVQQTSQETDPTASRISQAPDTNVHDPNQDKYATARCSTSAAKGSYLP